MIIRISRGAGERYDDFEVDSKEDITVLDLLFYLQEKHDQSLAFRYSCRGAVCGSCAIMVNGVPALACRTPLTRILDRDTADSVHLSAGAEIPEGGLLLEPLPKLPVIRDLVVDWEPFFECYRQGEPVLKAVNNACNNEYPMGQDQVKELEKYTNCILCALCWSACPVVGKVEGYPGPAALAKLYRFYLDPRETEKRSRLLLADQDSGWWACDFYKNCSKVCPKNVPPNAAIGRARSDLKQRGDSK